MIRKIISGGQTGADQGALDAAIKLGIPHGGWIPKGRRTEAGRLPEHYTMEEMRTANYAARTERNVMASDGTLILSHGQLRGGSALTWRLAHKHGQPCLHIDLAAISKFQAALKISQWLTEHRIEVLNVAGPRASRDNRIYEDTRQILESVHLLNLTDTKGLDPAPEPADNLPENVQQAVGILVDRLSFQDQIKIANLSEKELSSLRIPIGEFISNRFGLWYGNPCLMTSCRFLSKNTRLTPEEAADFIIRQLWLQLRDTHKIRVVK